MLKEFLEKTLTFSEEKVLYRNERGSNSQQKLERGILSRQYGSQAIVESNCLI
jgi:hypothetical protein